MKRTVIRGIFTGVMALAAAAASAEVDRANAAACNGLPGHAQLKAALDAAVAAETSGLNNHMWATLVNRDGIVCAVASSGTDRAAQWPGSRVTSAQKANAANAFSLDSGSSSNGSGQAAGLALSTANLYSAVQPGGSLYGLQHSSPVATDAAYDGPSTKYGTSHDPLVGEKVGGVNVFGGGLALYDSQRRVAGGLGLSGDTSCADHNIAWRVRHNLALDFLSGVGGVSGDAARPDNIVFDIIPNPTGGTGISSGGFGHPTCLNTGDAGTLPLSSRPALGDPPRQPDAASPAAGPFSARTSVDRDQCAGRSPGISQATPLPSASWYCRQDTGARPVSTRCIVMHPGTGQTSMQRLQPTQRSSRISGTLAPSASRIDWCAPSSQAM
jgi:uncharacterized protein GlcG (DUF336 family)